MSKHLGRRQRLARRKEREAVKALELVRLEQAKVEQARFMSLPKRERLLLSGVQPAKQALTPVNLSSLVHTKTLYLGRSAGSGNSDKLIKHRRRYQSDRFAPAFQALGHEGLATGKKVTAEIAPLQDQIAIDRALNDYVQDCASIALSIDRAKKAKKERDEAALVWRELP